MLTEGMPGTNGIPRSPSGKPEALEHWTKKLSDAIECWKFWQFLFFKQWMDLKQYCHARGIQIMGDIPIFVARDSADVWGASAIISPR
jgi:4-alpha-glucanotransferase